MCTNWPGLSMLLSSNLNTTLELITLLDYDTTLTMFHKSSQFNMEATCMPMYSHFCTSLKFQVTFSFVWNIL